MNNQISIAERLLTAEKTILQARETLANNLVPIGNILYFVPHNQPNARKEFKDYVASCRIELMRLNDALREINELKTEIPETIELVIDSAVSIIESEEDDSNKAIMGLNLLKESLKPKPSLQT